MNSQKQKSLTEASTSGILKELRLSKGDKLFTRVVNEEWENTKTGLASEFSESPDPVLIENLLIRVIEELYNEQNVEDANEKRKCAIKHDISLLMFGLLNSHYHTGIVQGEKKAIKLSVRYNEYLNDNIYVELEYAGEGTYAEIVVKDKIEKPGKQSRPLNHITSIAGGCLKEIGAKLYDLIKSGNYEDCLRPADFDELTGQRIDLPKPCFTREKYGPRTARGKVYTPPQIVPKPDDSKDTGGAVKPEPAPDKPEEKIDIVCHFLKKKISVPIWVVFIVALLAFCRLQRCSVNLSYYSNTNSGENFIQFAIQSEPQHREYTNLLPPIIIGDEIYGYLPSSD